MIYGDGLSAGLSGSGDPLRTRASALLRAGRGDGRVEVGGLVAQFGSAATGISPL